MSRARSFRTGLAAVAALAVTATACASSHLENKLAVTTASGRLVPLDSVTVAYDVGGLHVIQRPNYANDVVAVQLYLLGGRRQLTRETQGIESLLLRTSKYGTRDFPGDSVRSTWSRTGSMMDLEPDDDWTMFGFQCLTADFDASWSVFADRLMHPTLAAASVTLVRDQMLEGVRQRQIDPDGYLAYLSDSATFANDAYGLDPEGTATSLAHLDSAALASYEHTQMVTSRMLLVVVGNIERAALEKAVRATLATLPAGQYAWTLPAPVPAPKAPLPTVMRPRLLSTNYVMGVFQGPPASANDYAAFRVATALLSSRIGSQVRTKRALSYAAYAPYDGRAVATGGIYFTSGLPANVLTVVKDQVKYMRDFPTEMVDMPDFTEQFIFDYLAANSSDGAQADFLARAQLYQGDYRKAADDMEDLRRVSAGDVRSAARRYFKNIQFVYLGDTSKVNQSEFSGF